MRVPPASMNYSFFRAHKRDLTIAAVVAVVVMLGQTVVDGSMAAAIVSYRPSACKYGLFRSQCTVELKGRKTTPAVSPCGIPPPTPRGQDGKTKRVSHVWRMVRDTSGNRPVLPLPTGKRKVR